MWETNCWFRWDERAFWLAFFKSSISEAIRWKMSLTSFINEQVRYGM